MVRRKPLLLCIIVFFQIDLRPICAALDSASQPLPFAGYPFFDSKLGHHGTPLLAIPIMDRVDSKCYSRASKPRFSSSRKSSKMAVCRMGFSISALCGGLLPLGSHGHSPFIVCDCKTPTAVSDCNHLCFYVGRDQPSELVPCTRYDRNRDLPA